MKYFIICNVEFNFHIPNLLENLVLELHIINYNSWKMKMTMKLNNKNTFMILYN